MLPGAKLGLANLSVLSGLYVLGPGPGRHTVSVENSAVHASLWKRLFLFLCSAGGILSYLVMILLKPHCSIVFVSVLGGMFHNLGQLIVAAIILETVGLLSYLPVLLLCGIGSGCAVGVAGGILIRRCRQALYH